MDAKTLRQELKSRGIERQVEAARALKINQASVSRWLASEVPIPSWVEVALLGIRPRRAKKGAVK